MIQALKTKIKAMGTKLRRVFITAEFAFISIITVAAFAGMVAIVVESEKAKALPMVEDHLRQADVIVKENTGRLDELEDKIEEQQTIIEQQPRIIERKINENQNPLRSGDLRDRARKLRDDQRTAEQNRQ